MKRIKQQLADLIQHTVDADVAADDIEIPDADHGDVAYPVMKIAGEKDANPRALAEQAAQRIEDSDDHDITGMIERVEVAGPGYLNFHLDREQYAQTVVEALHQDRMGIDQDGSTILVEFSSPNLAKPMHIGHFRNTVLGDSLQRILRFVGHDVTSENYIGDWGTKHGQVIYAYKLWGSEEAFRENPMEHMYDLYVRLNNEADEETQEKAREWSKKIEEGHDEAVRLWEKFREATIEHDKHDYQRMGVSFDRWTGESVIADEADEMIEEGLENGIFQRDQDGSVYVDFADDDMPSTVVQRSDGSTLYISRDIANIRKRAEEGFDHNLYVVATEQNLHFQQLFSIAERFGITDIQNEHIAHGMLHMQEGSMSSSKGNIITLEDVMDEAVDKAEEAIQDRDVDAAEQIGIGAVKYANLSVSRRKDIEFDWDRALSFEGDSGPYLQYSNTRAKSILAKTEDSGRITGTPTAKEHRLIRRLAQLPETIEQSAAKREPAILANELSTLCEDFNSFYHDCPVLDADGKTRERRLKLVKTFIRATDTGLELLGIEPLKSM